jgi:hypothetical protein
MRTGLVLVAAAALSSAVAAGPESGPALGAKLPGRSSR